MRVLLDTNIWISYLLTLEEHKTIRRLVTLCSGSDVITLIVPPEMISELCESVAHSSYLTTRIGLANIEDLIAEFDDTAFIPPSLQSEFQQYNRDPKDDYLIAYGLIYAADYLIAGDLNLLTLNPVEQLQIIRPTTMRHILETQGYW